MFVIPIACIMMGCLTDIPIEVNKRGFSFTEEFFVKPKRCSIGGRIMNPCPYYKEKND